MTPHNKIKTLDELAALRASWREQGRKVVWTNGCFDILHAGHARSLADARALGDILIVGINSDAGVRALKGPGRPVMNSGDRAELLAALEAVDYVTVFDQPDPVQALARLRPDIHCKGAEYADGSRPIPERETVLAYGGEVRFLPLLPGRSTTDIIDRIVKIHQTESHRTELHRAEPSAE